MSKFLFTIQVTVPCRCTKSLIPAKFSCAPKLPEVKHLESKGAATLLCGQPCLGKTKTTRAVYSQVVKHF